MNAKLQFFFIFLLSTFSINSQGQKAEYQIVFESTWNAADHGTLPNNPHWSKLVGATHKTSGFFLAMGDLASTGVKNIAEFGSNSQFNSEVNNAIMSNEADQYINGDDLNTAQGFITVQNLVVDKAYPLLTLLSMIAPSPDWIIAINAVPLLDSNQDWVSSISIDLFPYDAGTDDGNSYSSLNQVSTPFQPIASLKNKAPFSDKKIGTLTITLANVLSIDAIEEKLATRLYYNRIKQEVILNSSAEVLNIEIFNSNGQTVKLFNAHNKPYSLTSLSPGLYIAKIRTSQGTVTKKFIKS